MPVGAFSLGQTKVNKNTFLGGGRVEEVCGFDVAVNDLVLVDGADGSEELVKVDTHVVNGHFAKVVPEVAMLEVWQDGYDLVLVTESGDERTDILRVAKVVQQFELVEDAHGRRGDINFLDGDVASAWAVACSLCLWRERHVVPVILVLVIEEVFGFVNGREGAWEEVRGGIRTR